MHKNNNPEPWIQNANSMLVLYSILAATCGILITIVIQDTNDNFLCNWWIPLLPLGISFFLFIFSAEAISEALDQNDVEKYISTHVLYNIGVICLFAGLSLIIHFHYQVCFIIIIPVLLAISLHWFIDLWLLFRQNELKHQEYLQELRGKKEPTIDREWWYWSNIFIKLRKSISKK